MEARIDNHNEWINDTDPVRLKKNFEELLLKSGFGILNFMEHYFQPQGFTAIWLLSESHFALHTFPEEHKTYIELSSCNTDMYDRFLVHLQEYKTYETQLFEL